MCDPFLDQVVMFAGNFAARGWAFCDGRTTFALPDLRGRFPTHPGAGLGLSARLVGGTGGHETVDRKSSNLPNSGTMSVSAPNWLFRPDQIDLEHDNMPPFACINLIIAVEGVFPSRP